MQNNYGYNKITIRRYLQSLSFVVRHIGPANGGQIHKLICISQIKTVPLRIKANRMSFNSQIE